MGLRLNRTIATAGGIGYLPLAPGTWAAIAAAIFWFFLNKYFPVSFIWQFIIVTFTVSIGIYCSGKILNDGEKDPSYVVIDEVAGLFVTLIFIPPSYAYFISGFILFRFFDIVKPFGIRKMESFKNGWGIMFDDVLAGVYSNILLRIIIALKLW